MSRHLILCFVVMAVSTGFVHSNPAKPAFWKGTPVDGMVEEMRSLCNDENDSFSCMKLKVMTFLDNVLKKDNYKLSEDIEVRSNGFSPVNEQRSEKDILAKVEDYVQSHDVTMNIPAAGAKVTLSPKSLNDDEFNVSVKFASGARSAVEGEKFPKFSYHKSNFHLSTARKSKLKKLFVPLFVFVLLKAMTLIPLALGVLGLKAWNALQLSFFSFITAFSLAIFQLCKKLAADSHHPHIAAAGPWDHHKRSFGDETSEEAQNLAYNAFA